MGSYLLGDRTRRRSTSSDLRVMVTSEVMVDFHLSIIAYISE